MRTLSRSAALFPLLFAVSALGQTAAAPGAPATARTVDCAALLTHLQSPDTHAAALEELASVPLEAVVPLMNASDDDAMPETVRKDLKDAFPAIFERLRKAQSDKDDALVAAWRQTYLVEEYKKFGTRDPKWDDLAIAALAYPHDTDASFDLFKTAVDAGCNDPLVQMLYQAEGHGLQRIGVGKGLPNVVKALNNFNNSAYTDGAKFWVHLQLGTFVAGLNKPALMPAEITVKTETAQLLTLFPKYIAQNPGQRAVRNAVREALPLFIPPGPRFASRKADFDKLVAILNAGLPNDPLPLHIAADYEVVAHMYGSATDIPRAEAGSSAGWNLNPLDVDCCTDMVEFSAINDYPRATMEKWFERGLLAKPGDYGLCTEKLYYLENCVPREEWLAFARECVQLGTPRQRTALVLRDALAVVMIPTDASTAGKPYAQVERQAEQQHQKDYALQPSVWKDLQSVYEKLLSDQTRLVDDKEQYFEDRSQYLDYAYQCHQWQAYLDLAKAFGNDIDLTPKDAAATYAQRQKTAAAKLAAGAK